MVEPPLKTLHAVVGVSFTTARTDSGGGRGSVDLDRS